MLYRAAAISRNVAH
jgi:cytoskeletal protein CcmA (bactofilin family)